MLVRFKKLNVDNKGYKREIEFKDIYLNSSSIISIVDYPKASEFLTSEGFEHASKHFSVVTVSYPGKIEEIVVLGSAESLSERFTPNDRGPRLLNE